jgi:catechol 2,3-dioxygenase-like lactoylglutathione lyase family enzyme
MQQSYQIDGIYHPTASAVSLHLDFKPPRSHTMHDKTAKTQGAHHVGLTVPNLAAARAFFIDALGFEQVGEIAAYPAVFVSDGAIMITLWQAEDPANAVPFDRRANIGLHHLALRVGSRAALEQLYAELRMRKDLEIEFEPEALGGTGIQHMMCRVPGNIRLELIAA